MAEWIVSTVSSMGYFGIVLFMFLENVLPPIPSELIMPAAGFGTARGELNFFAALLAGTTGTVLGSLPLYYLGRWVGTERLKRWASRWGHWLAVAPEDIDRANDWFNRHCGMAVLICRVIPGVRSLISIPAGINRMSLTPFLLYTTLGTIVWTAILLYAGRLLGENYRRIDQWLNPVTYGVLALLVISVVVRAVRLRRRAAKRRHAGA